MSDAVWVALAGLLTLLVVDAVLWWRTRPLPRPAPPPPPPTAISVGSDPLTGLADRRTLEDRLVHALAASDRSGLQAAVVFVDLDGFKDINDRYGHALGDQVLVEVARRLRDCARRTDTVARLGGDEFVVVLEDVPRPEGAATVAQKIVDALRVPMTVMGRTLTVTASVGIALYPDDAGDPAGLLREADAAMYAAKQAGRDEVRFSSPRLRAAHLEQVRLVTLLRDAAQRGQFELELAPQVRLPDRSVCGFEALLRWRHPDGSRRPAGSFLPLIADTQTVVEVGRWVLTEACRHAQRLGLPVAVNLSTREFLHPDTPRAVVDALERTGTAPALLELEVSEEALSAAAESTASPWVLAGVGVRLVLDGFGRGPSSLATLRRVPVVAIKAHPDAVAELRRGDPTLAAAGVEVAHLLGCEAVATRVETPEDLEAVAALGFDRAQGALFSAP